MHLAAGQPPDQKRVDRAGQQLALLGPLAGAGHIVEQPGDFGAGEIGIEQQSGLFGESRLQARLLQLCAKRRGATVLPDDGIVDRYSRRLVPDDDRLALVGDADCRDILRGQVRPLERGLAGRDDTRPDVFGVMLNPAGRRKMLREFLLANADRFHVAIEDDGARRGRALVDGEDVAAHCSPDMKRETARTPPPAFPDQQITSASSSPARHS